MYLITECDKFGNLKNFAIGLEFFPRIFFLKISDHNNMIKVMYFLKIYLSKIWGNSQEREEKKAQFAWGGPRSNGVVSMLWAQVLTDPSEDP